MNAGKGERRSNLKCRDSEWVEDGSGAGEGRIDT